MITFREFLESRRKYIAAIYSQETQDNLRTWAQENGFNLNVSYSGKEQSPEDFKFHTTIFYSEGIHNIPNGIATLDKPFKVKPYEFALLGENLDVPVLKVNGHGLFKHREYYEEEFGMRDRWKSYLPHVSLSYDRTADYSNIKLKMPKFDLIVSSITIEDIDESV
jgi:hypothetical protein